MFYALFQSITNKITVGKFLYQIQEIKDVLRSTAVSSLTLYQEFVQAPAWGKNF